MAKKERTFGQEIAHSLTRDYRTYIWGSFTKAIKTYKLVEPNDNICVCISGGKDSMLMALLFKQLKAHSDFPFSVRYLVMDPGYNEKNLKQIKHNLDLLEIPASIAKTDIFDIANQTTHSPCYLCAKMRRGALYRIAKDWGCNKIALGHHYDDVIETTLMNMLNSGSFQTMLPKLVSTHYVGMEVIRPLYLIREKDIIDFSEKNDLHFIRCACRFTEMNEDHATTSKRAETKELIRKLKEDYNPFVEKNIFSAASNVQLEKILGYQDSNGFHSFLDEYGEYKTKQKERILNDGIEDAVIKKAKEEHKDFKWDLTYFEKYGGKDNEN